MCTEFSMWRKFSSGYPTKKIQNIFVTSLLEKCFQIHELVEVSGEIGRELGLPTLHDWF